MKNIAIGVAIILLASDALAAEIQAPFGFNWGATKNQLKNNGVIIESCSSKNMITFCVATSPPKPVSFGDDYILGFVADAGLQKVMMVGHTITDDAAGLEGKELFQKIKSSLTKKYGEPDLVFEQVGLELYSGYDEFYQCLAYDGCGLWSSVWGTKKDGRIALLLKGLSRGEGYLELTYEAKDWHIFVDEYKKVEQSKDDDAL